MAFGDYESWGVVLSADVTIYKLRKRVSLSLAPALSWVVGVEQVTCSSPLDGTTGQRQLDQGYHLNHSVSGSV